MIVNEVIGSGVVFFLLSIRKISLLHELLEFLVPSGVKCFSVDKFAFFNPKKNLKFRRISSFPQFLLYFTQFELKFRIVLALKILLFDESFKDSADGGKRSD